MESDSVEEEEEEKVVVVEMEQRSRSPVLQDRTTARQFEHMKVSHDEVVLKLKPDSFIPTKVKVWKVNI